MPRFDKDSLPAEEEFRPYVKTAVTKMAGPFDPPLETATREGEYLTSEEPAFLALDADGWPYPVAQSVVERTYVEHVEGLPTLRTANDAEKLRERILEALDSEVGVSPVDRDDFDAALVSILGLARAA